MTNSSAPKIMKALISFNDPTGAGELQYEVESLSGDGLESIEVPFDPGRESPENFVLRLISTDDLTSGPINYDLFLYLYGKSTGRTSEISSSDLQKYSEIVNKNPLLKALPDDFFSFERYSGQPFARLEYSDVTERDMFGYEPIKSFDLQAENCGVWGSTGLRKFEFKVKGINFDQDASDATRRGCMYWKTAETNDLPEPVFEDNVRYNKKSDCYTVFCNTNELGEIAESCESPHPLFKGRFELHFGNNLKKEAWGFPVTIRVHKTTDGHLADDSIVSIDFGTSSTCAAFQDGGAKQLLRLSGDLKGLETGEKGFENPTNVMIYDWDSFQAQWNNDNPDQPVLTSPYMEEEGLNTQNADFDSGYTVDRVFSEIDDHTGHRKMEAILTKLKSIPFLLERGRQINFRPYNEPRPEITVIADLDREDSNHFNPVRFYGYMLGKIINNPKRKRYHTNYLISYPVKFDDPSREYIRASLADGIMRSLPAPVRAELIPEDAVQTKYEESVACLGALIPHQLQIGEEGEPQMFAIFDLGGGTLDTSYGVFRLANEEEEEESEYTIQILGTGGAPFAGGENLIHKLAFQIYLDNHEELEKLRIPLHLPLGESLPAEVDDTLVKRDANSISESNLRIMTEKLCRTLFKYSGEKIDNNLMDIFPRDQYPDLAAEAGSVNLKLRNTNNDDCEVRLRVEGIDKFLEDAIESIIQQFKSEMQEIFYNKKDFLDACGIEDFSMNDVNIYLGGNASRQKYVKPLMERAFPRCRPIAHIGDTDDAMRHNPAQRTTVKTAVAFGQLEIGKYSINRDASQSGEKPPFRFYVFYNDPGTGKQKIVLNPMENSREWHMADRIDANNRVNLFYTEDTTLKEGNIRPVDAIVIPEDPKKKTLFVRVYDGDKPNTIEYRVGSRKDVFDPNEPTDHTMIIQLKDI